MIDVVIVEDDENIARLHERFLKKFPLYSVRGIATNFGDAIDLIETLKPQLVLLDIYLKDRSGIEVLDKIRDLDLDTDFIVISAAKDIKVVKDVMHRGVFDYLIKPIIFDRLKESLEKYLNFYNTVRSKKELQQYDIDNFMSKSSGFNEANVPKGIDQITLKKILTTLESLNDYISAEDLGEKVGASRNTARRYLEYLAETGIVDVTIDYGKIGRPEKKFILMSKKN